MAKLMPLPWCHPSSLASVRSRMVHLSGAGLPELSWKKAVEMCVWGGHPIVTRGGNLLHSCAKMCEPIKLSFDVVSGIG